MLLSMPITSVHHARDKVLLLIIQSTGASFPLYYTYLIIIITTPLLMTHAPNGHLYSADKTKPNPAHGKKKEKKTPSSRLVAYISSNVNATPRYAAIWARAYATLSRKLVIRARVPQSFRTLLFYLLALTRARICSYIRARVTVNPLYIFALPFRPRKRRREASRSQPSRERERFELKKGGEKNALAVQAKKDARFCTAVQEGV